MTERTQLEFIAQLYLELEHIKGVRKQLDEQARQIDTMGERTFGAIHGQCLQCGYKLDAILDKKQHTPEFQAALQKVIADLQRKSRPKPEKKKRRPKRLVPTNVFPTTDAEKTA